MELLVISVLSAFVGFAFNKMMEPGMIFEFYRSFLDYIYYKGNSIRILHYIAKPLGYCIICNTTWIGFIIAFLLLPGLSIVKIIICGMTAAGIVIFLQTIHHKFLK